MCVFSSGTAAKRRRDELALTDGRAEQRGHSARPGDVFVCCIVLLITLILKLPYFIMQDFCNND